jgi:hypothetical protein
MESILNAKVVFFLPAEKWAKKEPGTRVPS